MLPLATCTSQHSRFCQNIRHIIQVKSNPSNILTFLLENKPKSICIRSHVICSIHISSLTSFPVLFLFTLSQPPELLAVPQTLQALCYFRTFALAVLQPGMLSPQISTWLASSLPPGLLVYQKLCSSSHFLATLSKSAHHTLNVCYCFFLALYFRLELTTLLYILLNFCIFGCLPLEHKLLSVDILVSY